jgi:hypothetical protein
MYVNAQYLLASQDVDFGEPVNILNFIGQICRYLYNVAHKCFFPPAGQY